MGASELGEGRGHRARARWARARGEKGPHSSGPEGKGSRGKARARDSCAERHRATMNKMRRRVNRFDEFEKNLLEER